MELKEFYYIECSDDILTYHRIIQNKGPSFAPILWFNEGLFKIIHLSMVSNMCQSYDDWAKSGVEQEVKVGILWDEAIDVPSDVARYLLSEILEDKNQQGDSSSSSDAQ